MRSNNKIKTIGLIISVLMIMTAICGVSLIAGATEGETNLVELTTDSGTVGYKTLDDALSAAKDSGGKLTLLADCTIATEVIVSDHVYELDLNGKTLTSENLGVFKIGSDAKMTITDSVGGGKISSLDASAYVIYNYGTLTLNSVTVTGAGGIFSASNNDNVTYLTVTDSKIESTVYSAIENRGTATITNVEASCTSAGGAALENHGTLTVDSGKFVGTRAVLTHGGTLDILGGNFEGTTHGAIYMIGGEVNVFNGYFMGKSQVTGDYLVADVGDNSTLTITSGIFPNGITTVGTDIASIIAQGSALYDTSFVKTEIESGVTSTENDYFYVYPDCAAIVIDSTSKLVESFDSVNDAIEFLNTSVHTSITVLSSTDEDITIPYSTSFLTGRNKLSGNVTNYGNIFEGVYSGKVTNYGNIYDSIFEGEVVVMGDNQIEEDVVITGTIHAGTFNGKVTLDGGEILGGEYNCEVVLNAGSTFSNEADYGLILGDGFKLTNNGGTLNCTSHIGEPTCTDPASCRLCGESFGETDPNAHVEGAAATCSSYAICLLCGEEYGELGDHVFGENGKCTVAECDVAAEVRIGSVFYTDCSEALANAVSSDMIVAVCDFEIDGLYIPEGVTFDGADFTITLGEDCDVTVLGTIIGGTFVVNDGGEIEVEVGGTIDGGSFYGEVYNSGTILSGSFLYGGLYNNPDGTIHNEGGFVFGDGVWFENVDGDVLCTNHVGGEATCRELAVCLLCETAYGDLADHPDFDRNHICDYGCDERVGEHSDSNTDGDHLCDHGCNVSLEECYGGKATCTSPAICEVCSQTYGEVDPNAHKDENNDHVCDYGCDEHVGEHGDSNTDNDHVCDYGCGETIEECSGGKATCTSPAICEICGESFGELDPNGHKWLDATVDAPKTCELCGKTEGDPLSEETTTADGGGQTTTDGGEQTTDGGEQTTTDDGEQTTDDGEQTTDNGEQTTTDDASNKKKGCKGTVGIGAAAIVVTAAFAGLISFKKKED